MPRRPRQRTDEDSTEPELTVLREAGVAYPAGRAVGTRAPAPAAIRSAQRAVPRSGGLTMADASRIATDAPKRASQTRPRSEILLALAAAGLLLPIESTPGPRRRLSAKRRQELASKLTGTPTLSEIIARERADRC